jgi:hypothetical protein
MERGGGGETKGQRVYTQTGAEGKWEKRGQCGGKRGRNRGVGV